MTEVSIVICAHNPKEAYLKRTLASLEIQTLNKARWELLLIDNLSDQPLSRRFDLSWHPEARHVREEKIGLTNARLCGIAESRSPLIIFVDDDNILASNYLETALEIAEHYPFLGAWGGGCVPEFEVEPEERLRPFLRMLALRDVSQTSWSNLQGTAYETVPYGAGLCVRSEVAELYAHRVATDPVRVTLGRTGQSLASAEDVDLAYVASDLGMGTGVLETLRLVHLIPKERLQLDYLVKLAEESRYSNLILLSVRNIPHSAFQEPDGGIVMRLIRKVTQYFRDLRMDPCSRAIEQARRRGDARARAFHREHHRYPE